MEVCVNGLPGSGNSALILRFPRRLVEQYIQHNLPDVGDRIEVLFDDGAWYCGKILRIKSDGETGVCRAVCGVAFDDGEDLDDLLLYPIDFVGIRDSAEDKWRLCPHEPPRSAFSVNIVSSILATNNFLI